MIRWKNSLVRLVCAGLCLFSLLVCTSILVPDRGGQTHPIGDEGFLTAAAVCVPLFLVYYWAIQGEKTRIMTKFITMIHNYTMAAFVVVLSAATFVFARYASPPPAIAVLAVIALPEVALLALCVMFRCGQASPEK